MKVYDANGLIKIGQEARYANLYVADGSTAQGSISTTPTKVTGFAANGPSNDATPDHTNDQITINTGGAYKVCFQVSFSGTVSTMFTFHLRNNGVELTQAGTTRTLGTGGDNGSCSFTQIFNLSQSDVLTIYVEADGASKSITPEHMQLSIVEIVSAATGTGSDSDAIHDNVAAEISAILEKVTPVSADLLVLEDSADSNNKKRVQIGNLPGGGGLTHTVDGSPLASSSAIDFDSVTPAAVGSGVNVTWQKDALDPTNVSAYVQEASASQGGIVTTGVQAFEGAKTLRDSVTIGDDTNTVWSLTFDRLDKDGVISWNGAIFIINDSVTAQGSFVAESSVVIGNDTDVDRTLTFDLASTNGIITFVTATQVFDFSHIVDVTTGLRIDGAAATGEYLRGDGTDFISSAIQTGDVPDGADDTAIHDNVVGEINAVAVKGTPVGADLILIEDSAASFAKKKITVASLPGGSGGTDVQVDTGGNLAAADFQDGGDINFAEAAGVVTATIKPDTVTYDKIQDTSAGNLLLGQTGAAAGTVNEVTNAIATGTPASGDFLLGWESTGELRKFDVGALPAGSEVNALVADGISGIADDELAVGTGGGTAAYQILPNGAVAYSTAGGTFSQASASDLTDGVPNTRTLTVAGTANEITSSAGAQNLTANRTWTLSLPTAIIVPGSIELPNAAGGTLIDTAGEVTVDTTTGTLNFHDGTAERVLSPILSKGFTLPEPVINDLFGIWITDKAITVVEIKAICEGGTSAVINIEQATTVTAAGTLIDQITPTTAITTETTITSAAVPAERVVSFNVGTVTGAVDSVTVTIFYREDA